MFLDISQNPQNTYLYHSLFFNRVAGHTLQLIYTIYFTANQTYSHSKTLIDNIFSNVISHEVSSGNITTIISDHLQQFLFVSNVLLSPYCQKSSIWKKSNEWDTFSDSPKCLSSNGSQTKLKVQTSLSNYFASIVEKTKVSIDYSHQHFSDCLKDKNQNSFFLSLTKRYEIQNIISSWNQISQLDQIAYLQRY